MFPYNKIKVTAEKSTKTINFLDTTIYFNTEGKLESTLFVKPQDICTLLHNNSFHPESCKNGIIYSQALRYRRIITDNEELDRKLTTHRNNLIRRGYNLSEVKKQFDKIRNFSQADLLFPDNTKTKTQEKNLPFVIPYDNTTIQISKILQTNWHRIEEDGTLNCIWTKKPFVALKKHKNLKDTLVKSKTQQEIITYSIKKLTITTDAMVDQDAGMLGHLHQKKHSDLIAPKCEKAYW